MTEENIDLNSLKDRTIRIVQILDKHRERIKTLERKVKALEEKVKQLEKEMDQPWSAIK